MAGDHRQARRGCAALDFVQLGVTDPARCDAHEDLAIAWYGNGQIGQLQRRGVIGQAAELAQDHRFHGCLQIADPPRGCAIAQPLLLQDRALRHGTNNRTPGHQVSHLPVVGACHWSPRLYHRVKARCASYALTCGGEPLVTATRTMTKGEPTM